MPEPETLHMKLNRITCTALLSLLFGVTASVPCLSLQQGEKHQKDQSEQSKKTQEDAQQQQQQQQDQRQADLSSQPTLQAKPQPPSTTPQQEMRRGDRGQQRQPARDKQRDQAGSNRPRQPDMRNHNSQHPQDFNENRSRLPFDQRNGRPDGGNRDGRGHERPNYHQDDSRDHHNDWQGRRARDWRSEHRTWEQRGGYRGYRIPEYRFGRYFGPRHFFRIHDLPVLVFSGYPRFLYGGCWFSLVDPWPEYWADDWYEADDVYIEYSGDGYYLFNRRYPGVGIAVNISM